MTTERSRISPLELRLYITAILAAVYTISWRAIGGHAIVAPPATAAPALPIVLPAGWQLASQPTRVETPPRKRAPRVRTRSS